MCLTVAACCVLTEVGKKKNAFNDYYKLKQGKKVLTPKLFGPSQTPVLEWNI